MPCHLPRVRNLDTARGEKGCLGTHAGGERVVLVILRECTDGTDGLVEKLDLRRERIAEEARDAECYIDTGPPKLGERDDFIARHAPTGRLPHGPCADECEGLRNVIPAGTHV